MLRRSEDNTKITPGTISRRVHAYRRRQSLGISIGTFAYDGRLLMGNMTTEISDFERRVQDRIAQRDAPGATVSVRREFSPGDSLLAEAGYDFADGDRLLAQAEAERRQAEHAPAPARMTDAMIQRTIDSRVAAAVDVFRAEVQQAINELSDMIAETLDEIEHEVADAIRTLAERVTDLEIIGKAQRADNVTALPIVRKNSDDAA